MRSALTCLLLAACAGTGCLSLPSWWEKPNPAPTSTTAAKPARPRPAVTADQINDNNAAEMAGVLLEELDREARAGSLPSTAPAAGDSKSADGKHR